MASVDKQAIEKNTQDQAQGKISRSSTGENDSQDTKPTTLSDGVPFAAIKAAVLFAVIAAAVYASIGNRSAKSGLLLPSNSVYVSPASFAVRTGAGANDADAFRNMSQPFNPPRTSPPFFQIFDLEFASVLGPKPEIRLIARNDSFAFAHEAPIWVPSTDEVFFASFAGGAMSMSGPGRNNRVSKIKLKDVGPDGLVDVIPISLADDIQMTNGGTPFGKDLLFVNSGRANLPPNIALVNPSPPYNRTILLDNFFGRQFNSLNDVKVHPKSRAIFFTDPAYGWLVGFRPAPQLPNQVYRFDGETHAIRVVADGFAQPNGIAFSPDGRTAYISDTGALGGSASGSLDVYQTEPSTIYAFDVDPVTQAFTHRRVFAYIDSGIPDGIVLDTNGNVYAGCGDGVQVWNARGTLLGKIFIGTTSANMAFAGPGRLVILAETHIFLASIAAGGANLVY